MKRKILSLILVLSMAIGMTFLSKATVFAEDNGLNADTKIIIEAYNGENKPGEKGFANVHISMQSSSGDKLNLSNYLLVVEKLTANSDIILNDTDVSDTLENGKTIYTSLGYEIPENLKSNSLKFKVKLVEKNNTENVIAVSNEAGIYPYAINNGVLKYYDSSMGEKYLLTVEADKYVADWNLVSGGYGNATVVYRENFGYDYYLDPNNSSVAYFYMEPYCLLDKMEVFPPDAGTVKMVGEQSNSTYEIKLTAPATIRVKSLPPAKAKDWENVASNFTYFLRLTDEFKGDDINKHFFTESVAAEDIATLSILHLDTANDLNYDTQTGYYYIDYDRYIEIVSKYFNNVPSLKNVNVENMVYYDSENNQMVFPYYIGFGYPSLATQVVDVFHIGNGRYAIHFKVSKDDIESSIPDMEDINDYTECTLVVENNGFDEWKYVSFEKGFTHSSESVPEIPDPEEPPVVEETTTVEIIEQAPAGSSVNVQMKDTTVVTKDILTAAKGKDVNVVLEMDGYSWTINGKDIDEVKDVDLKVTLDTKAIPDEKVNALAGDKKTKQLTLAYDGEFGFEAELNINVGKDYAKQYGNLYWYNDNKLTFVDAGQVDENGNLSLTFNHASDYVIVFDKEAHDKKAVSSTKTGDTTMIMAYALPMVLSVLGLSLLKKRYNN